MSETSDYTIVGDEREQDEMSAGDDIVKAADEIHEVLRAIQDSLKAMNDATLAWFPEDIYTDEERRTMAYGNAEGIVEVLKSFGTAVASLPKEGHAETACLLVEIVSQANSALADIDEKNTPAHEADGVANAVVHKCHMQAVQRAIQYPGQEIFVRASWVKEAMRCAIHFVGLNYLGHVRETANIINPLLAKYVRSLTAINETALNLQTQYVWYAESELSKLDPDQQNDSKGDPDQKMNSTDAENNGSQMEQRAAWYQIFAKGSG